MINDQSVDVFQMGDIVVASTFSTLKMEIDGIKFKVNLWGTVGQEKYRQIVKLFFADSKILIFVYDITSSESFKGIESWHEEISESIEDDIIKGIVGNKIDLFENEAVNEEGDEKYAKSINVVYFCKMLFAFKI